MKFIFLILLFSLCVQNVHAQEGFVFRDGFNEERIAFEEHSNLIVLPVKVNGVDFNFILDTGANKNIIFNLKGIDSLSLKKGSLVTVKGYGDKESLQAYRSIGNTIEVGENILNNNAEVLVLSNDEIDMSPKVDVEVHGLLGIDFFRNFITHLDYKNSYIKAYMNYDDLPRSLRNEKLFDLKVKNDRPFVQIELDNNLINGSYDFLIDTGSGDALWVLNQIDKTHILENSFEDYLGFGINGKIYGLRTKVNSIKLFDTTLKKVAVSYPYKEYHSVEKTSLTNDGSLGGEVLRRYDVIIDFPNKKICLKPNRFFNEGFYYNMSGLGVQRGDAQLFTEISRDFTNDKVGYGNTTSTKITVRSNVEIRYKYVPKIYIDYVREGSPGDQAGIQVGDQLLSINGLNQKKLSINRVNDFFFKNPFKKIKMKLRRGKKDYFVEIINIPLVK